MVVLKRFKKKTRKEESGEMGLDNMQGNESQISKELVLKQERKRISWKRDKEGKEAQDEPNRGEPKEDVWVVKGRECLKDLDLDIMYGDMGGEQTFLLRGGTSSQPPDRIDEEEELVEQQESL
ncbi:uncharacterized protein LOC114747451 [Neltuma alba]|uniref:uncharacterized protein LOC114747451 n=1 Tax=Neltuma alba TaxID=207710 RepID=UPI0010A55405|nr:uncharacterized protein LOC114747451 [Prosopis alba]